MGTPDSQTNQYFWGGQRECIKSVVLDVVSQLAFSTHLNCREDNNKSEGNMNSDVALIQVTPQQTQT